MRSGRPRRGNKEHFWIYALTAIRLGWLTWLLKPLASLERVCQICKLILGNIYRVLVCSRPGLTLNLIILIHILYFSADLPGWPLLSPLKIQMQKCDKCSREFCSPINYRRHIRVHRRSLNVDKVFFFLRDLIFGCCWHYVLKFCCMCSIYKISAPSFLFLHVEIRLGIHCAAQLPFPCFCWTLLDGVSPSSLAEVIFILQESHKSRDLLGAFWDKVNIFPVAMSFPYKCGAHIFGFIQLSLDEVKEVVSFKDVTLEVLTGSFIFLSVFIWLQPSFELQRYVLLACNMLEIYLVKVLACPCNQWLFLLLHRAE